MRRVDPSGRRPLLLYFLNRHTPSLEDTHSSPIRLNLRWLRNLVLAYGLTCLAAMARQVTGGGHPAFELLWLLLAGPMYLIGFTGLRQPEIFAWIPAVDPGRAPRKKYERSNLDELTAKEYVA